MNTLIIYDNTGNIFLQRTGSYTKPQGNIQFIEVQIPDGKILKSINTSVTPNTAVYEDMPKTDIELTNEKINALESENASINYALMIGGLI